MKEMRVGMCKRLKIRKIRNIKMSHNLTELYMKFHILYRFFLSFIIKLEKITEL